MSLSNQLHHRHAQGRIGRESRRCLPEILTSHSMGAKCPLLREAKWKIRSCGCCSFLNGWTVGRLEKFLHQHSRSFEDLQLLQRGLEPGNKKAPGKPPSMTLATLPLTYQTVKEHFQVGLSPKFWYRGIATMARRTGKRKRMASGLLPRLPRVRNGLHQCLDELIGQLPNWKAWEHMGTNACWKHLEASTYDLYMMIQIWYSFTSLKCRVKNALQTRLRQNLDMYISLSSMRFTCQLLSAAMESFHLASCSASRSSRSSRLLYTGFYTCAFAEGWALGAGPCWAGFRAKRIWTPLCHPQRQNSTQCLECLKAFLA